LKFSGFSDDSPKSPGEPAINSETSCVRCTSGEKSAKLLLITGEWNFYYCYRCRRWSRSHYSSKNVLLPVESSRTEKSLTWFWRTERELMEENARALAWIRSIFTGRNYEDEKNNLA
jgi:late competence protein required for DNA uptake (superfamily II DNA/RNA helicase)